jgi:hypothetical protein
MPSPHRDSQQTGRLRLRHLLETTEAAGERMDEARPRFERLARADSAPRVVAAFNLFQTPEPLADRLAAHAAAGRSLGRVLEPSAGLGRLYRAVRAIDPACPVTLVEIASQCAGELYRSTEGDEAARLLQADFLNCGHLGPFDTVVMNPPFKQGRDIKHIRHALTTLSAGGRLVALCADGPRQRAALRPLATHWEEIPAGTFDGTGVRAVLLVIDTPG